MLLTVINPALIDQMMAALSTTLVYSLLQGVALAALAGLVIILTRTTSSAARYNLLIAVLIGFGLTSAVTFGLEFGKVHQTAAVTASATSFTGNIDINRLTPPAHTQPMQQNYLAGVSSYITAHHNTIVLIWFLIICIKAIQLAAGMRVVYRLKRMDTHPETGGWKATMQQMAQCLGIKQKIELLESGLAKVPMVIGHLKPVILIPIGLLSALSTAEVEAILMHELAHIHRRDYLVNMLQSLVEIVFFFNPAVLWVSQLIKTERENCCDDIALAQNTSKHSYIKALVSCEEYQQGSPAYAVAFSGQKNSLMSRVKRMINNRNHSLNTFEKALLTICLVMSGLCLSAFAERETIKKTIHEVVKAITHKEESADPVAKITASPKVIKQLPVDTITKVVKKDIPFDEAAWFRRMDSIKNKALAKVALAPSPRVVSDVKISDSSRSVNATVATSSASRTNKINIRQMIHMDSITSAHNYFTNIDGPVVKPATDTVTWASIQAEMVKDGLVKQGKTVPVSIDEKEFVVNGKKQSPALTQKYFLLSKKMDAPYSAIRARQSLRTNPLTFRRIVANMVKDGIIDVNDRDLSFKLNNDEFIVNGKKQPDATFQKYFDEFVKTAPNGQMTWAYGYDITSRPSVPPISLALPNARGTARMMMDEMVNDGLMERGKPLPFSIDDNAFVVNGKKQPDVLAQKYRVLSKSGFPRGATGHPTQSQSTMSKIILQMVNDKLINAGDENFSFVLNNDDFIVNGKKQPDEVFQRYLNDFVKKAPGGKMNWIYSNVSSTKTADK